MPKQDKSKPKTLEVVKDAGPADWRRETNMAEAMTWDYDDLGDVLYLFEGEAYDTLNMTLDDHLVLRLDPSTHRVVGLMVHDLKSLVHGSITKRTLPIISDSFRVIMDSMNALRQRRDAQQMLLAG